VHRYHCLVVMRDLKHLKIAFILVWAWGVFVGSSEYDKLLRLMCLVLFRVGGNEIAN